MKEGVHLSTSLFLTLFGLVPAKRRFEETTGAKDAFSGVRE